jgi:AhpD family alkylhydroperoxidase
MYIMKLDERVIRLIAVGASIAANCQPCLETNVTQALQCGIDQHEIASAIEVGKRVRQGAASKMDRFASSLNPAASVAAGVAESGCGCSS